MACRQYREGRGKATVAFQQKREMLKTGQVSNLRAELVKMGHQVAQFAEPICGDPAFSSETSKS